MVAISNKSMNNKQSSLLNVSKRFSLIILITLLYPLIVLGVEVSNLDHPSNNSYINYTLIDFNFTAADDVDVKNCTLWADFSGTWSSNESINPDVESSTRWNITISPPDGTYMWNVNCSDNEENRTSVPC